MLRCIENFRVHYKTELCKNWTDFGYCEFDKECAYAHGYEELAPRQVHAHKNYKTKMCKQWHESTPGYCTYGVKCQFIHNELEDDIPEYKPISSMEYLKHMVNFNHHSAAQNPLLPSIFDS